ncbi:hypothetical protein [Bradyrhizobium symbiodeficiens]|uniref:Uncharacterized protein n=1 Tax=Bradyrhizobium symbiodeficiens TaxID=1404367 RepID=A0A6G9A114_9BRAD|nr:hypothetical protein [Bradyrhizobium symbiodeficiens]QIP05985.1 hypothetical protein HAV00_06885 [Bradyrhizobium symbiodeficiens]
MTDKPAFHGQAERDAHAMAIGRIAMVWNEYQATLGEIYADLFAGDDWNLALSTWYAIPSDRTQRDALRAVAMFKLAPSSKGLEELNWLLEKTNEVVSFQRNVGLHTRLFPITAEDGTLQIYPVAQNDRIVKALENTTVLKEYAHYESQMRKMLGFAVGVQSALSSKRTGQEVWPERPQISKRST